MNNRAILIVCTMVILLTGGSLFFACTHKKLAKEAVLIELGRRLFYDRRLSVNNSKACGTCHNPSFAFTDGYKRSLGVYADLHQRNTQPLFNLKNFKYLTAADSTLHNTVQQMNNPLFNEHPKEMGVKGHEEEILQKIRADKEYEKLFSEAFSSKSDNISWENIKAGISSFINSIISDKSPYDKYVSGDSMALTPSQKRGKQLFFSDKLKCSSCHGGFNFSASSKVERTGDTIYYFNTGLYNTDGLGSYPDYDMGLYQFTKHKNDMGKFRVPSLRNLIFTAPYFHDGSTATLDVVVDVYASGGRIIKQGIYAGDGTKNPFKDSLIAGFLMNETEKKDLIDFLQSLSDSSLIKSEQYGNPFTEDETKKKY